MVVRILNNRKNRDKFFDCVRSEIVEQLFDGDNVKSLVLVVEFEYGGDCSIVLTSGDEIYYMNDNGKTIAHDLRCKNK